MAQRKAGWSQEPRSLTFDVSHSAHVFRVRDAESTVHIQAADHVLAIRRKLAGHDEVIVADLPLKGGAVRRSLSPCPSVCPTQLAMTMGMACLCTAHMVDTGHGWSLSAWWTSTDRQLNS